MYKIESKEVEAAIRHKLITINWEIYDVKDDQEYLKFLKDHLDFNARLLLNYLASFENCRYVSDFLSRLSEKELKKYLENHLDYDIFEDWLFIYYDYEGQRTYGGHFSLRKPIEDSLRIAKEE